jgi:hypothetical protein
MANFVAAYAEGRQFRGERDPVVFGGRAGRSSLPKMNPTPRQRRKARATAPGDNRGSSGGGGGGGGRSGGGSDSDGGGGGAIHLNGVPDQSEHDNNLAKDAIAYNEEMMGRVGYYAMGLCTLNQVDP